MSAIIVVPKLNCKATPSGGSSIYVGVGIQSVNSYARLYLACTPHRVARYYPSLVVNGTTKNIASDVARPGDTIEFAVSQSVSQVTGSVIDMTHKFIATSNGTGSGTSEGIMAGDFPVISGATSGVPNFGTLAFSSALINGYPFGSAETGLQADRPLREPRRVRSRSRPPTPPAIRRRSRPSSSTPDGGIRGGCRLRRRRTIRGLHPHLRAPGNITNGSPAGFAVPIVGSADRWQQGPPSNIRCATPDGSRQSVTHPPKAKRSEGKRHRDEERHLVPLERPIAAGWLVGDELSQSEVVGTGRE